MRPPSENPDGRTRRQPQRRGRGGRDGVPGPRQLAALREPAARAVGCPDAMKTLFAFEPALALGACLAPPPPPPAPYQAVGANAAWSLLIDSQHITFIQGENVIRQPAPTPINGVAGEIYQTPRINVNIVHASCT